MGEPCAIIGVREGRVLEDSELPTNTFASSPGAGKEPRSPTQAQIPDWVLFTVNDVRYAIPLTAVERVVAAAEVTPLPGAPDVIRGAANIAGDVLPVFDLRRRFSLPARAIMPADRFLIIRAAGRRAILLIDDASGLLTATYETLIDTRDVAGDLPHISGVIISEGGLVLIHDVDAFLSEAESLELDAALAARTSHDA